MGEGGGGDLPTQRSTDSCWVCDGEGSDRPAQEEATRLGVLFALVPCSLWRAVGIALGGLIVSA